MTKLFVFILSPILSFVVIVGFVRVPIPFWCAIISPILAFVVMVVLEGSNTVLVGYSFTYSGFRRNGCVGGFQYRFGGHRAVLFPHTQMARTSLARGLAW